MIALQCCVSAVQCCGSAICVCISSLLDLPPTPLGHHRTPAELLVVYSRFPLAVCFTHSGVYMSIPISQFIPPSPFPLPALLCMSTHVFSTSASQFLPWKQVHLYHFSRLHIRACVNLCLFFFLIYFNLWNRL